MAEIILDPSWRQIGTLIGRTEHAAEECRWTDVVARWRDVLAHPCAHHQVVESENLEEMHQARSSYAARLLQAGDAVVWSPGRNESCSAGSERKYVKCCGPVPAASDDAM